MLTQLSNYGMASLLVQILLSSGIITFVHIWLDQLNQVLSLLKTSTTLLIGSSMSSGWKELISLSQVQSSAMLPLHSTLSSPLGIDPEEKNITDIFLNFYWLFKGFRGFFKFGVSGFFIFIH